MKIFVSLLIKTLSYFTYLFPRKLTRCFFGVLGVLWFDIFRFRRKIVLANLDIAFPEMEMKEKIKIGRKSVYSLAKNLADLFRIPYLDQKWIDKNVIIHGQENIEKAVAMNKGVYLLSLHVGNGDLAGNLIQMLGYKLFLITKFFKSQWLNDIWFSLRGAKGVQYIEPHGEKTPFQILKALKQNGLVVFVIDQFMGKPYGIETLFFGRKTGTAQGLALFHIKTKSPIVPVYCYEGDDNYVHLVFEPFIATENSMTLDKEESIKQLTQLFCYKTEEIIKKHPDQWMWVHRRWKKFE